MESACSISSNREPTGQLHLLQPSTLSSVSISELDIQPRLGCLFPQPLHGSKKFESANILVKSHWQMPFLHDSCYLAKSMQLSPATCLNTSKQVFKFKFFTFLRDERKTWIYTKTSVLKAQTHAPEFWKKNCCHSLFTIANN